MKKFIALFLIFGFGIAVCYAVPQSSYADHHKIELAKKHFELQAFDVPVSFDVPAAPSVSYDSEVMIAPSEKEEVLPQSNSPPERSLTPQSYSMAGWR